ncbi:MAG: gamma-glutamylcyclotransferase family protein [Planctomycetota bacterium]|nr:gamma-glutamylcyclotransferase family protein [Planctomycetota bacterium]MEC9234594.1 gamma-glutamylcyclotransferase family protein [Planctomycetota bacterium]
MNVLCFAYGANLDRVAMKGRCPEASPLGRAVLPDHRLAAMKEGWLTIEPAPGEEVEGLVWSLTERDLDALDRYEEVDQGLYRHERRLVVGDVAGPREVLVYVGANHGPGRLRAEYARRVARAARRELGPGAARRVDGLSE